MQLEVTKYLLVDTLKDWLVIQITQSVGVNVFRSKDRAKADKQYEDIKAGGYYHMLALVSGEGELISSEYKPVFAHLHKEPKQIGTARTSPFPDSPWPPGDGFPAPEPKPALPPGFGTGLPSGFKTGK